MTTDTPGFENTHKRPGILEKSLLHDGSGLRLNIPQPYMNNATIGQFVQLGSSTYQLTWVERLENCSHFKCTWDPKYGGIGIDAIPSLDIRRCRPVTDCQCDDYAVKCDSFEGFPTPDSLIWTPNGVDILRQVLIRNREYFHVSLQPLAAAYASNYGGYVHRFDVPDAEDYERMWSMEGETLLRIPAVGPASVPTPGELLNWFGTIYVVLKSRYVPERPSKDAGWDLHCLRIERNTDG